VEAVVAGADDSVADAVAEEVVVAAADRFKRFATTAVARVIWRGIARTRAWKERSVKRSPSRGPSIVVASTAARWDIFPPSAPARRATRRATTVDRMDILHVTASKRRRAKDGASRPLYVIRSGNAQC
jgi:hypothetical protein